MVGMPVGVHPFVTLHFFSFVSTLAVAAVSTCNQDHHPIRPHTKRRELHISSESDSFLFISAAKKGLDLRFRFYHCWVLFHELCWHCWQVSNFYTAVASKAKMSSSVFLEGAVTTADKAVDGDTGGKLGKKSRLPSNSPCKSSVTSSCSASRSV